MSYQNQIHPAGRFSCDVGTSLLYTVFCILISAALLFATNPAYAQWPAPTGNEQVWATNVEETADGGYVVLGGAANVASGGYTDCWLMKLDSKGNVQWFATFGGNTSDIGNSVYQTSDGGYAVAGYQVLEENHADAWLLKVDANGIVQWQKSYGGDEGDDFFNSVEQTSDNGYILVGGTWSDNGGDSDGWALKLNSQGQVEWEQDFGGDNHDFIYSVEQTKDGGYVAVGKTSSSGAGLTNGWMVRINALGQVQWQKTYGGDSYDTINSIIETDDGGFVVAGSSYSFGTGNEDAWIMKLDSTGATQWQKSYGGQGEDLAFFIEPTKDGGYIAAGRTSSYGTGTMDAWVLKLNSSGDIQWQKTYGEGNYDLASTIHQTDDGGYIVSGGTYVIGPNGEDLGKEFWVAKLDSNGAVEWMRSTWEK
ncbi:MAG: hypothetical protein A2060_06015 [Planctomycetes bacterium GWA2_50_13]|nr:MAG: hypothetical protein A2060_06015 [Planctomycetes bacterium GWA2_50_13]OHB96036.1 MAG: hypothetical protein A3I59_10310 [Planctomycetes bacterium RIFCSPLOWO2_02_FULL_50_16]OHC03308.1 MAG: hypothetical protein A3G17_02340 [Planctomycetes bacterium RIFCSPLOWO2_12_FULL_50_35]HCN19182.1 hypothetical protein [Planctomycetia bacterium]